MMSNFFKDYASLSKDSHYFLLKEAYVFYS